MAKSKIILPRYTDTEAAAMQLAPGEMYYNTTQDQVYITRNNKVDSTAEGGGGGAPAVDSIYEVDLGSIPRIGGYIDISGFTGLTANSPCEVSQVAYPITGKGTLYDENEMDIINCTAYCLSSTVVRLFWTSRTHVKGKFFFFIRPLNLAL